MTMSNPADRSSRMMTDDLKAALAVWRAVVTDRRAVSVEWPVLKPDWLGYSRLFLERKFDSWAARSIVFEKKGSSDTGL